jgi:hypothetical protein
MTISAPAVSLREITRANRLEVEALAVTEVQAGYVTGIAQSLVEAAETPDAGPWYRTEFRWVHDIGVACQTNALTRTSRASR